MKTNPLYYENGSILEFEAKVLSLDSSRCHLVLSETAFYPEGGGQPADTGLIEGIAVQDVCKKDGIITHILSAPLPESINLVKGRVDGPWRRHFMQQHTGQHLLSGCLESLFARETVSVHLGDEYSSVEVKGDRDLSEEEVALLEDRANDYICENREIRVINVKEEDISSYKLRRPTKVKGDIRLVEIDGTDLIACGGVHCSSTGELKLIKVLSQEQIRGNLRIFFSIGNRARQDYRRKHQICRTLASDLSVPVGGIIEKWGSRQEEIKSLKIAVQDWRNREASLFTSELIKNSEGASIVYHWDKGDGDYLKLITKLLLDQDKPFCLTMINRGKLQWAIGCSLSGGFLFNKHRNHLLESIKGKGGGKSPLWQGMGENVVGWKVFQDRFKELGSVSID